MAPTPELLNEGAAKAPPDPDVRSHAGNLAGGQIGPAIEADSGGDDGPHWPPEPQVSDPLSCGQPDVESGPRWGVGDAQHIADPVVVEITAHR